MHAPPVGLLDGEEEVPFPVRLARYRVRLLARLRDLLALVLVLVGDLADDLLEEVLDRGEPGYSPVLVHDDRHPQVAPLELAQELRDLFRLRHEVRLTDELG